MSDMAKDCETNCKSTEADCEGLGRREGGRKGHTVKVCVKLIRPSLTKQPCTFY